MKDELSLFRAEFSRDDIAKEEKQRVLNFVVRGLTEKQRFYLMEYFSGKSYAQIARENNVAESTVWRTVKRSFDKLLVFLEMAHVNLMN